MCLGFQYFAIISSSVEPGYVAGYSDQPQAGGYGVGTPAGARYFLFSRTVQAVCGTHPFSCSVGTGIPSRWKAGAQVTTDLPAAPTLRIRGDLPLLPVCVPRACTGTTSLFYFHFVLLHYQSSVCTVPRGYSRKIHLFQYAAW